MLSLKSLNLFQIQAVGQVIAAEGKIKAERYRHYEIYGMKHWLYFKESQEEKKTSS